MKKGEMDENRSVCVQEAECESERIAHCSLKKLKKSKNSWV